MKRTYKRPDGSDETVEGTPEELVEFEKRWLEQYGSRPVPTNESPKKPGVLHGAEVDGIPLTDSEKEWVRVIRTFKMPDHHAPVIREDQRWRAVQDRPLHITSCSICHRIGCLGDCWVGHQGTWCGSSEDSCKSGSCTTHGSLFGM